MMSAMPSAPLSDGGLRNSSSRPTANIAASPALMGPRKTSTSPRVRGTGAG